MDSGACDPVIGPEMAADYPIEATEASKRGIAYVSASGDPMPNYGGPNLVVKRPCGKLSKMGNNVTDCTGALQAVTKTVDANNMVVFSPYGSFVMDLDDNSIDWMERVDDGYELEYEVLPYADAKPLLEAHRRSQSGFQGRR